MTHDGIKVALACHSDPQLTPSEVVGAVIGTDCHDENIMYSKQLQSVSGALLKGITSGMIRVESAENVLQNYTHENGEQQMTAFAKRVNRCQKLVKKISHFAKVASLMSDTTTSL